MRTLEGLDLIIKETDPDIALVYSDSSTIFAASLIAFYNQVTIAHI